MRTYSLLGFAVYLIGCNGPESVGGNNIDMATHPVVGDLAQDMATPLQCAAAKGLAGTVKQCVDFNNVQGFIDSKFAGWNFNPYRANCWIIKDNFLQVNDVANFTGDSCGIDLPQLDSNYNNATISIISQMDINDPKQQARIFVNIDDPATVLSQETGLRALHQAAFSVDSTNWPNTGYHFILKFSSLGKFALTGWQISSIAVLTNP